ncbi:MAG: sugar-binding protein [Opitutaceae bacterium]|jgi:hypothetical protein
MHLRSTVLIGLVALASSLSLRADDRQRCIISDFEDAGTWRVIGNSGSTPGAWFSGVTWMGGSQNARFGDDWVGEIRFDFANESTAPRRLAFRRVKMSRTSGFLDGIEFDADSRGLPVALRFTLMDSTKKRHTTPAIRLGTEGWRRYRLELDEKSWPDFENVRFPASVEQVVIESAAGGAGAVFIDDLALTGSFTTRDRLTVAPVYSGIAYGPGKPFELVYRARNAMDASVGITAALTVRCVGGAEVFSGRSSSKAAPFGQALVRFALPALPVGAYEAAVTLESGDVTISYEDNFGVFVPNGGRINRKPMWFGIQDQTAWQGEGENRLHLDWMRQIGFDLNRLGMTPGRFSLAVPRSLDGWRNLLQPFEAADIDTCLLYFETPGELLDSRKDNRAAPADLEAFGRYAADVGTFFGAFPHVRYVEFWNEPDIGFFHGTMDEYWGMLQAFSEGIRSTAPGFKITTGGATVKHPHAKPDFNEDLYSQHGDLYDVAAFHAHGTLAAYAERQEAVEGWQSKGGLSKPVGNTESGERSGYDARGRFEQAITLVKKLTYVKSRPRSEFYLWFTLQDYWDMDPDADDSFGLITSDNRAKPSLVAYNEVIRQLANTDSVATPAFPAEVTGYAFVREDGRHVLVCWASDGTSGGTLWIRSAKPVMRVDLFGRMESMAASTGGALAVGKEPVYLVSDGPLALLDENQRPLSAPAEIYRDPEETVEFQAVVRNLGSITAVHRLALRDARGAVVCSAERSLKPGERAEFSMRIPSGLSTDETGTRIYRLELVTDVDTTPLSLSLPVHDSYAIRGEKPATIRLATAQDVHELTFDPSIRAWKGPQDLSVEARIGRDDKSVIFHFDVTDDRHVQTHPDAELWRGDSVQVAFYNPANGAHTLFDLGLRGNEAVAWCHKNTDLSWQGRWSLPLEIRREATRTVYEIAVPFEYLGLPKEPAPGTPVRFAFLVNEDDGQGRVRWMNWRGGLGDNQDIQRLGHGILK